MPYFQAIRQDDYPATDDLQCLQVFIPAGDEYKALLSGFLALLCDAQSYEDPDSAQADGVAAVFDTGYAAIDWDGRPPEREGGVNSQIMLFPINMNVAAGNAVVNTIDAAQRLNGYQNQSAAVINQALDTHLWMAAGDWSYRITCVRQSGSGILTFDIDDSDGDSALHTTHDFYSAATVRNAFFTGTFTLAVDGDTGIQFSTVSKHASSSGYNLLITCLEMWKTADI